MSIIFLAKACMEFHCRLFELLFFFFTERGERAGVRCGISNAGEEQNQRRGRVFALRRVAPQRDLVQILRQLFQARQPKWGGRRPPTPLGHSGAEVACRS